MTLDYFYGQSGELFSYFRIPKALFQDHRFRQLSTDARTLYGILLDRMSLSVKNGWLDEQNRVFIIFTIEDVKRALCCADNKATKLLRELEKFGLIERKRRGLGKPSLVYVKNFSEESSLSRFLTFSFEYSAEKFFTYTKHGFPCPRRFRSIKPNSSSSRSSLVALLSAQRKVLLTSSIVKMMNTRPFLSNHSFLTERLMRSSRMPYRVFASVDRF